MLSGLSRGSLTILTAIVSLMLLMVVDFMVLSGAWDRSCTETVEGTGADADTEG